MVVVRGEVDIEASGASVGEVVFAEESVLGDGACFVEGCGAESGCCSAGS